jgi:integrase
LTCYKRLIEPQSEAGQALTIEQLCRLETAAASRDAWEVAFCAELIAANTGMRGGEIKKLRLGMIDLENRRVRITRAITKSDAGARLVALNRSATEAMCRLYRRAQMLGASAPDDYLLPADLSRHTKSTDPLKGLRGFDPTRPQASWDTAWRNLREAAGLHGLGFHSLRHTFVTMMAQRGVPLPVVRAMVGHMSDAVTRLYTHISEGDARKAVEQLDGVRDSRDFVDAFVDGRRDAIESNAKLLN